MQVPNGLALSECRGYDDWPGVAVSHPDSMMGASERPDDVLNMIVANPAMIDAYRAGVPGNGKPFPDGSSLRRSRGNRNRMEAPFAVRCGHPGRRWLHGEGQQDSRTLADGDTPV